jgi:hypothetical protein
MRWQGYTKHTMTMRMPSVGTEVMVGTEVVVGTLGINGTLMIIATLGIYLYHPLVSYFKEPISSFNTEMFTSAACSLAMVL